MKIIKIKDKYYLKDAEYITVRSPYREQSNQVKVSDYCVVDFPFVCYAPQKDGDGTLYPCKLKGWYVSGYTRTGKLVCTYKELFEYPAVWWGTTSSQEFIKKHFGKDYINVRPREIRDFKKYLKPATKLDVMKYFNERGYDILS